MAYRFQPEEYRQPHNGQSVFGGGMIPNIYHPDTTQPDWASPVSITGNRRPWKSRPSSDPMYPQPWGGEDEKGNFTQTGADKKYTFTKPRKKGYSGQSGDIYYEKPNENPHEDPHGGSTVPRKPKPNPKSPSGGMALPLPQKVK